ncbi:MAG: serine/threonine protein kinase [Alphaproteobacteria bacterium]|nr:serine/threonine protein kinase [Alphaproteobacteria bacterium]
MPERNTVDFDSTLTLSSGGPADDEEETRFGITVEVPDRRLRIGPVIGVGGMGEVREAEQQALARRVAVKSLAEPARSRKNTRLLLQEAWITGALEHPNIVPIHDIDYEGGEPRIVMKHVEGIPWGDVLDDPSAYASDALAWNLGVLIAVCNAVGFAHSRKVLHRDLKPDNVMIGRFGEVYVMDWGIAVALEPRPDGRIPVAREQKRAAGTPAYMAPEMLTGRGELLTERTDVYLLGGLLHRIVAGRPPRGGDTLEEVLDRVANEDPAIDPSWPLAELLETALARDPDDRPASAEAFREGIELHLRHRDARRLAGAGLAKLDALREGLAAGVARRQLYDLHSAARFALDEARTRWPDVPGVDGPLRDATLDLVAHEIGRGDDQAAQLLLDRMEDVPPAVDAEVARLRRDRETQTAQLERFREDVDLRTAMVPRIIVASTLAAAWVAVPALSVVFGVPAGYPRELTVSAGIFVATVAIMAGLWPWFLRSRVNRTLLVMFVWMPLLALIFLTGAWLAGLPAAIAAALEVSVYFTLLVMGTSLVDWRLSFSIPPYLAAFLLGAWMPEHSLTLLGAANAVVLLNVMLVLVSPVFRRDRPRSAG